MSGGSTELSKERRGRLCRRRGGEGGGVPALPAPGGGTSVGSTELELGEAGQGSLNAEVVTAGTSFHFRPGTVHRVTALEDTTILEVSTPQLDDIVRLEDSYGRAGTTEP